MTPIPSSQRAILAWSEPITGGSDQDLLGESPKMQALRRLLTCMAPYDVPVLMEGEESTGKRLAAEVIHHRSPFREGPFVIFDCAAFTQMMLPIELFGCAAGICDRLPQGLPGMLELAQGGTLFLRHIEQMPTWAQARLLRTLETRTAERLGANEGSSVNVRIVAATTSRRTLDEQGTEERLRADLRERLGGGVILTVPPLRERGHDILLLSRHFLKQANQETGRDVRGFSKDALAVLEQYPWPGNLRELRQCIRWAFIEARGYVSAHDFPRHVRAGAAPVLDRRPFGFPRRVRRKGAQTPRGH